MAGNDRTPRKRPRGALHHQSSYLSEAYKTIGATSSLRARSLSPAWIHVAGCDLHHLSTHIFLRNGVHEMAGQVVAESSGRDTFWRNVGIVLTGSAAAQIIPLLSSLAIARLFLPATFGLFAAWLGAVSVGAIIATGRYEVALALEGDGDPRRIGMVSTLTAIGLVVAGGVALVSAGALAGALPREHVVLWLAGIPAVAVTAIGQSWQAWAVAEGRYVDVSAIRIVQALVVAGAQIVAGVLAPSALALAVSQVLGVACGILVASRRLPLSLRHPLQGQWRGAIRQFWSRHRRFPLLSLPADSVNTAAAQLPLLIVSSRFGLESAGFMALTMRMLGGPISMLGSAVLDVFRRRAVQAWRAHGNCRADYLQTFWILTAASAVFVLVVGPFSEQLFALAFGEHWRMTGVIALWLLPMFALRFVASPLSYTMYVASKQHVDLMWQVGLLAVTVATLMVPLSFAAAVQAYGIAYGLMYILYLALSYRYSRGDSS